MYVIDVVNTDAKSGMYRVLRGRGAVRRWHRRQNIVVRCLGYSYLIAEERSPPDTDEGSWKLVDIVGIDTAAEGVGRGAEGTQ